MTEPDWLSCREPREMLQFLRDAGKLSERKVRLFACACVRRLWRHLKDRRSRRLIEVAESFADGAASVDQLRAAFDRGADAQEAIHWEGGDAIDPSAADAVLGLREELRMAQVFAGTDVVAGETRAAQAWERVFRTPGKDYRTQEGEHREECEAGAAEEQQVQAALLRDVVGNVFRAKTGIDPAWLTWNSGTVVRLAEAAYAERSLPAGTLEQERLAVLADALEEAGAEGDILGHLREQGAVHVRGCWVLDLILNKE